MSHSVLSRLSILGATVLWGAALVSAQSVSGTITDAITGTPLVNAKVSVVELSKSFSTDSLGHFVSDTFSKGTYTIRAEASGYLKQSKTVMLASHTEAGTSHIDLDIKLFSLASNADTGSSKAGGLSAQYFFRGHGDVEIAVCDGSGKVVRTVFDRSRKGGTRTFVWDGKDNAGKLVQAGTYTCKLSSGNLYAQRTLVLRGQPSDK